MMDDIGLGGALANILYLFLLFITVTVAGVLLAKKKNKWALWWVSVMLNLFTYLYFLGNSTLIGWLLRVFSIVAWPIINVAWAICLIVNRRKNKNLFGK